MMNKQGGFLALVLVIVLGAAALLVALNSSLLGLGALDSAFLTAESGQAASLVDGCLDETLRRLTLDSEYGGETLDPFLGGSCIIDVSVLEPAERLVMINGVWRNFSRTRAALVTLDDEGINNVVLQSI